MYLGEAGGGGVLYGPDEQLKLTYSWNLGTETNNVAEAWALWQGLVQASNLGIQELSVVGDSRVIIQAVNTKVLPSSSHLNQILRRILEMLPNFQFIEFFHALRAFNEPADRAANDAIGLSQGTLVINGEYKIFLVP